MFFFETFNFPPFAVSDAGKNSHGNELYASLWICRSFFKIVVEIWAIRNSSTFPSMTFKIIAGCFFFLKELYLLISTP